MKKYDIFLFVVTVLLVVGVFFFSETVPIHWNASWQVDGYGSRYTLLILAFLPMVVYYGMSLTKRIDPRKDVLKYRGRTYDTIQKYLSFFFILLVIFFYYMTLKPESNGTILISFILGGMFIMLGNYMPTVPKNYFLGIKTPWTLASEVVWKKTHKVAGYCYVLAGVLIIVGGLIDMYWVIFASIGVATVYVFIYSYIEFKRL